MENQTGKMENQMETREYIEVVLGTYSGTKPAGFLGSGLRPKSNARQVPGILKLRDGRFKQRRDP